MTSVDLVKHHGSALGSSYMPGKDCMEDRQLPEQ